MRYQCPRCDSNLIGFVLDNITELDDVISLIRAKKIRLSDAYKDYQSNTRAPKWICYECYDCGVILEKLSMFMPKLKDSLSK